jgi:hypothetical protein
MNEGSGNKVFNLSDNRNTGSLTNVTWTPGGVTIAASVSRIVSAAAAGFNAAEGSIEMLVKPSWNYNDGVEHFFWTTYQGNNRRFLLRKRVENVTEIYTDSTSRGSFTFQWTANTLYHVVLNWGTNKLYIDKAMVKDFSDGGLGIGANNLYIGDDYAGANASFSGNIYYFCVRNRALSAAEIQWLHREPFAMFERSPLWQMVAGGISIPVVLRTYRNRRIA